MNYRSLGSTGMKISEIALGTVKVGRNRGVKYPASFELPDDRAVIELLETARELGINLIDTAPAYGTSEARIGKLLKEAGNPESWRIATKAGESFDNDSGTSGFDFSPAAIRASVENSLRLLGREQLDIVLLHSDGNDLDVLAGGALDALLRCRDQGLIRACGLSGKTVEGGIAAIDAGADLVMVTHHPGYDGELPVIDYAGEKHCGVLIKKALNSGHLAAGDSTTDPATAARQAIRYSLDTPGVTSLVIGTISPDRLRQNVESATMP